MGLLLLILCSLLGLRSEEHTSELQSRPHLVCRLLLEKKKKQQERNYSEGHTLLGASSHYRLEPSQTTLPYPTSTLRFSHSAYPSCMNNDSTLRSSLDC